MLNLRVLPIFKLEALCLGQEIIHQIIARKFVWCGEDYGWIIVRPMGSVIVRMESGLRIMYYLAGRN
jgi:hypothetical protein